jgi:hypothetical protein
MYKGESCQSCSFISLYALQCVGVSTSSTNLVQMKCVFMFGLGISRLIYGCFFVVVCALFWLGLVLWVLILDVLWVQ